MIIRTKKQLLTWKYKIIINKRSYCGKPGDNIDVGSEIDNIIIGLGLKKFIFTVENQCDSSEIFVSMNIFTSKLRFQYANCTITKRHENFTLLSHIMTCISMISMTIGFLAFLSIPIIIFWLLLHV
jgi:hypothetical protein